MTEGDIIPLLKPVLPNKVFSYVVPQNKPVTPPWSILSIYDIPNDVFSGQAETMTNIQIDVYANTVDEARIIRDGMRQAIKILGPTSITERQSYESDTKLFRATLECQVWQ
ncbi:hypothetical protein V6N22_004129 [Providencia stuartii]|uniref:hypothetical protein n=1 Tax=Providencia TaxID=586 RepID=UPI00069D8FBE|nr:MULTISPECIES: hypothetical protein [Providencia]KNZ84845.1 putative phage structural component [Providencia stuartii]WBA58434.1 hypothetical protein O7C57_07655 [Providencia sp. 21OH12SH02B-Prov]HEM6896376.1 hypothetical protein [Providencia stuartii]HEM6901414.1 hypothetical protein [Providencia stuartii]HEM8199851.1 hypothetical protein [Providencia stuartii]